MRVCMVTYSFYESDARVQQYATALAARGDQVDVMALRREGLPGHEVLGGVSVHRIQNRRRDERNKAAYFFRIMRFLGLSTFLLAGKHLKKRYDLIHVHSVPDFLVFAALVPKLFGARVVLDIHDILPEFYASKFHADKDSFLFKFLLFLERRSVRFADFTIVANDLWLERIKARSARNGDCMAIRNYPDPRRFLPRPRVGNNKKFVMLYPGTLNRHQGVDVAMRAFAKIKDKIPGSEFQIYGEGPTRADLTALAAQLGVKERVRFKDFVPSGEIAKIMAEADLGIVPKRASSSFGNEAASTKIFEFMALGVPLVVSRTKIDSHYLNDSVVKFFESDNEDDLAEAIVSMAGNPKLREQFAAAATRYAAEHTWAKKKHEYLQLVDSLAAAPPASVPSAMPDKLGRRYSEKGIRLDRFATLYCARPLKRIAPGGNRGGLPILMYHGIREQLDGRRPYYETSTTPAVLASHMKFLRDQGYQSIELAEAVKALSAGASLENRVVITFDDGYRDFYTSAFPVLQKYGFSAALFLATGSIGADGAGFNGKEFLTWPEVRELQTHGITIGSHTVSHPQLRTLRQLEIDRELGDSKRAIEDKLGAAVTSFAYPYAFPEADRTFVKQLQAMLEQHGYENGVCTTLGRASAGHSRFFLPRLPINNWDDESFLRAKLEGGYDWLHLPQRFYKVMMKRGPGSAPLEAAASHDQSINANARG